MTTVDARSAGRQLISIVIPAYNETECVDELARRLQVVFESEPRYDFEVIVVENGSKDDTWFKLCAIHEQDPRFKIVRLSRNFRMDGGLTAGLDYASGDACVLMTADLQDPPELLPQMLRKYEEGYDNVYGIVTAREGTGPIRRMNSQLFYWLAAKLTDNNLPRNASDFRLLSRRAYRAVASMQERNRFVRGLVAWSGFRSIGIPMVRPPRFGGSSHAFTGDVLDLAIKGIFAHSMRPLRMISITGVLLSVFALLAIIVLAVLWVVKGVPFAGFGSIVALTLLVFGLLSMMLGVISEYVGLIYEEVKQRPNFIVQETVGFPVRRPVNGRSGNERLERDDEC